MTQNLRIQHFGPFEAEVHFTNAEDHTPLAITRLRPAVIKKPHSIILMHGSYSNRHFWISPKGVGVAGYLVERGFDVWLPEWRGHGLSPKTVDYAAWTAEDQIRLDYEAVSAFVARKTRRRAIWVGHSYGGLLLLGALARNWLPHKRVVGAAVFGSQIAYGEEYLHMQPLALAATGVVKMLGRFPSRLLRLGPEDEPPGVVAEIIRWKQQGRWLDSDGIDYLEGFGQVQLPIKVFAGAGDTTDPAVGCEELFQLLGSRRKEYCLLGKAFGCRRDYGHVDMIVSKDAAKDVWPLLADWLERLGDLAED